MKDVIEVINPLCENKQKCDSFAVNAINLGQLEKCRYVWKYLLMTVECGKFIWHRGTTRGAGRTGKRSPKRLPQPYKKNEY